MPSNYEVVASGRKLVGSAQWRARGGVLQHGSLPLHGDLARIMDYLWLSDDEREEQRPRVRSRAITLEDALGRAVSFVRAAQALAEGFAQALNVTLASGELTDGERALAGSLRRRRYTACEWTGRT
jgi:lipoate-protein ligase A